MTTEQVLREQVVGLLQGGHAHMLLKAAVVDFPMDRINERPPNVEYSPWALLEHIRLAQEDILEFITDPEYEERAWPEDYWPAESKEASAEDWQDTLAGIEEDLETLLEMARNPEVPLLQPLDHAPDYTFIRELLLVADHTAYHVGEFAILRQVMGTWGRR